MRLLCCVLAIVLGLQTGGALGHPPIKQARSSLENAELHSPHGHGEHSEHRADAGADCHCPLGHVCIAVGIHPSDVPLPPDPVEAVRFVVLTPAVLEPDPDAFLRPPRAMA